ncbi:hypothetical protein ACH5RR_009047 [Cinchona calisaya]|uniref:hAT-like transposase RNase-H fold domain-containing protein n=1 Tax=Cinchona calisaya TaxID=153742 RepID=A0ABD3AGY4_9GENT
MIESVTDERDSKIRGLPGEFDWIMFTICCLFLRLMEGSDENLAAMASRMKKKHDRYWANVDKINVLLVIAVVLDLHFKL